MWIFGKKFKKKQNENSLISKYQINKKVLESMTLEEKIDFFTDIFLIAPNGIYETSPYNIKVDDDFDKHLQTRSYFPKLIKNMK